MKGLRRQGRRYCSIIMGQFRSDTSCVRTWRQDDMGTYWFEASRGPR